MAKPNTIAAIGEVIKQKYGLTGNGDNYSAIAALIEQIHDSDVVTEGQVKNYATGTAYKQWEIFTDPTNKYLWRATQDFTAADFNADALGGKFELIGTSIFRYAAGVIYKPGYLFLDPTETYVCKVDTVFTASDFDSDLAAGYFHGLGAFVELEDSESENLPSLDSETIAAKMQEFYSLCKWIKNNMLVKVNWWPRMVLAFMQANNTIAALNSTTGFTIEPLTEADRNGWTITLDNSEQGGEGAQGILRLVYNSDTDWYVEGKAWHEGDFHTVLQYSTDVPGYEMVGDFDGNGGVISDMNGDIANSSIAKVIYPESQFTVDFRKLLDDLTVTTISNNVLKGINTFLYPPQVPTPYSDNDATNKAYVDAAIAAALGHQ